MKVNGLEYKIWGIKDMSEVPLVAKTLKRIVYLEGKRGAIYSFNQFHNGAAYLQSPTRIIQVKSYSEVA